MNESMTSDARRHAVATLIREGVDRRGRGARAALGRRCDVSAATVTKWVDGHTIPDPDRWSEIEDELGLEVASIAQAAGVDLSAPVATLRAELDELSTRLDSLGDEILGLLRRVATAVGAEEPPGDL